MFGRATIDVWRLRSEAFVPKITSFDAGGIIAKPIYSFPGGRRFHFIDPGGNELAVWSTDEGAA